MPRKGQHHSEEWKAHMRELAAERRSSGVSPGRGRTIGPKLPVAPVMAYGEPRPEWPPTNVAELEVFWALRDHRYHLRRSQLSEAEKAAVRIARRADVLALPGDQQAIGQRALIRAGWA